MEYSPTISYFFPVLLILLSSTAAATDSNLCSSPSASTDLPIFHVQSKCTPFSSPSSQPPPSELDSVLAASRSDPARLLFLSQKTPTKVPIASGLQFMNTNNYVLRAKLGTPGQLLFLALDTGSDASWVPCAGCTGCPSTNATFTPSASSTYASIDCGSAVCPQFKGLACSSRNGGEACGFNMTYGGDSAFSATLAEDTLQLGTDALTGYRFGCVNAVVGGSSMHSSARQRQQRRQRHRQLPAAEPPGGRRRREFQGRVREGIVQLNVWGSVTGGVVCSSTYECVGGCCS